MWTPCWSRSSVHCFFWWCCGCCAGHLHGCTGVRARVLNHTGTHPSHTDLAIANAINYHNAIGSDRKEARLRYIQNYWTDQVRDLDHVILNTPKERHRSCGIANAGIEGINPKDLAEILFEKHRIWTVGILCTLAIWRISCIFSQMRTARTMNCM